VTANSPGQKSPDKKKARTRNSSNTVARTPDSSESSIKSQAPVFATINPVTAPPAKPHLVSVYKLKRAFNCQPVQYNRRIFFTSKKDGITPVSITNATTQKSEAKKKLEQALQYCGTLEHQANLIHEVCTTPPRAGIGIALGILPDPSLSKEVGGFIIKNALEVLGDPACHKRQTNIAMTFRNTAFFC
jgi:hypothetical protein